MSSDERRRSSEPLSRWWWAALIGVLAALTVVGIVAWTNQGPPRDDVGAVQVLLGIVALGAASAAAIYAIPELREWRLEHHRYAGIDMWIDIVDTPQHPGHRLPKVTHEADLSDEPMYVLARDGCVVRACVHVLDRFPLRDCVLNIVVPSSWELDPRGSERHTLYPAVTPNSRVNPDGDHAVCFTVLRGDFSPKSHFTAVAVLRPRRADTTEPIRVMVELDSTPALETDDDRFRFALIAPHAYRGQSA